MRAKSACVTFLIAACMIFGSRAVIGTQPPDISKHLLTKPQVLFSLPYGSGKSEIGLVVSDGLACSVTDFALGPEGSIYIADAVNGKLKRFSRQGKLMMGSEGEVRPIWAVSADGKGNSYAVTGIDRDDIAAFDSKGKRLHDVESRIQEAVRRLYEDNPGLAELPQIGGLQVDGTGNLYLFCGRHAVKVNPSTRRAELFGKYPHARRPMMDRGLSYSFETVRSGQKGVYRVYRADRSLASELNMPVFDRVQVTVHAANGSAIKELTIPSEDFTDVEKQLPSRGVEIEAVDRRGHFYTRRSPLVIQHIPFKNDQFLIHYSAVLEYDNKGRFVGVRAVIDRLAAEAPPRYAKVDEDGNIYWLDFKSDCVSIMMAPVPHGKRQDSRGTAALPYRNESEKGSHVTFPAAGDCIR